MRAFTVWSLTSLLGSGVLAAQLPGRVEPGMQVRVTHGCAPGSGTRPHCRTDRGTVETVTAESLVLGMRGGSQTVRLAAVERLSVHAGRRIAAARALGYPVVGFFVGGLAGGGLGYASCAPCDQELEGLAPVGGAVVGAGVGVVVGLVLGLMPRDRWVDAPLEGGRVSVQPRPDGGLQLGFGVRF